MVSFTSYLLPVAAICSMVTALPPSVQMFPNMKIGNLPNVFSATEKYPLPNDAHITAHDPNILEHNDAFYMFKGGVHIPIYKATDMNGPWKKLGTVLPGDSVIKGYGNATRPWAPTTVEWKGKFYCFYSLSKAGTQHSAIGVATTDDIEKGPWKDHGKLLVTDEKDQGAPFNETNAIDPSFIVDQKTGTPYLNYGSYWKNIWQIPLADDLLSLKNNTIVQTGASQQPHKNQTDPTNTPRVEEEEDPKADKHDKRGNNKTPHKDSEDSKNTGKVENTAAVQLTFMPGQSFRPEEGSWISYHDGYYYLWFSQGNCCKFEEGLPPKGKEYVIISRAEEKRKIQLIHHIDTTSVLDDQRVLVGLITTRTAMNCSRVVERLSMHPTMAQSTLLVVWEFSLVLRAVLTFCTTTTWIQRLALNTSRLSLVGISLSMRMDGLLPERTRPVSLSRLSG